MNTNQKYFNTNCDTNSHLVSPKENLKQLLMPIRLQKWLEMVLELTQFISLGSYFSSNVGRDIPDVGQRRVYETLIEVLAGHLGRQGLL